VGCYAERRFSRSESASTNEATTTSNSSASDTFSHHRTCQTPLPHSRRVRLSRPTSDASAMSEQRQAGLDERPQRLWRNGAFAYGARHCVLTRCPATAPWSRPARWARRPPGRRKAVVNRAKPLPIASVRRSTSRLMPAQPDQERRLNPNGRPSCACRRPGPRQRSVWTRTYRVKTVKPHGDRRSSGIRTSADRSQHLSARRPCGSAASWWCRCSCHCCCLLQGQRSVCRRSAEPARCGAARSPLGLAELYGVPVSSWCQLTPSPARQGGASTAWPCVHPGCGGETCSTRSRDMISMLGGLRCGGRGRPGFGRRERAPAAAPTNPPYLGIGRPDGLPIRGADRQQGVRAETERSAGRTGPAGRSSQGSASGLLQS